MSETEKVYECVFNKLKEEDSREWVWSEPQLKKLLKWDRNIDHLWIEVFKKSIKIEFRNVKGEELFIYSRKQKQHVN